MHPVPISRRAYHRSSPLMSARYGWRANRWR
jgi:hypothetical protein